MKLQVKNLVFLPFLSTISSKNQVYQLKLLKKCKINNIFQLSMLEYDITKKKRAKETIIQLKFELDNNDKRYKIKRIWNSVITPKNQKFICRVSII